MWTLSKSLVLCLSNANSFKRSCVSCQATAEVVLSLLMSATTDRSQNCTCHLKLCCGCLLSKRKQYHPKFSLLFFQGSLSLQFAFFAEISTLIITLKHSYISQTSTRFQLILTGFLVKMVWYWPFSKASTPKANSQTEPSTMESDAKALRKSVASTINRGALYAVPTSCMTCKLTNIQDLSRTIPQSSVKI